jgi:hypothetical protein
MRNESTVGCFDEVGYGLDDRGISVRFPEEAKNCSLSTEYRRLCGLPILVSSGTWAISTWLKRPRRETDYIQFMPRLNKKFWEELIAYLFE